MKKIFTDSRGRTRSGWQLVLAVLVMVFSQLGADALAGAFTKRLYIYQVLFGLLYAAITLGAALWLFRTMYKGQFWFDMDCFTSKKRGWLHLLYGLGFGALCFAAAVAPLYLTGQYAMHFNGMQAMPLLAGFVFYIGVGVAEEVICRGLMQHALLRFGKWPALVITSAMFGLLHLANPGTSVNGIAGVILAGLVLGISMMATNSILFAIGFHITWNWVQGYIFGISVSGTGAGESIFVTEVLGQNPLITGGAWGAEAALSCLILLALVFVGFLLWGRRNHRFAIYDYDRNMPKIR